MIDRRRAWLVPFLLAVPLGAIGYAVFGWRGAVCSVLSTVITGAVMERGGYS